MAQDLNFFTFNELGPEGRFLWVSPSIHACLGYDADEVIGVSPYTWIHPDDIPACRVAHQENVLNEIVGTQMSFRMRRKNGTYASCVIFGCVCYQYIVSCHTFKADGSIRKFAVHGIHSAAMASIVGSRKEEFERISRNHKAFGPSTWNPAGLDLEIRACLLLNRFTRNLCIMYASPSCELIFNLDPDDLLGKPLLVYIRADDLASFVEQADQARASATVRHLRFWFQSPTCRQEIPCEAMIFGASDAMILILRKCLPFRRRQFITDNSSTSSSSPYADIFASAASAKAAYNSLYGRKYNTSSQDCSSQSSSYEGRATYGRYQNPHNTRDDISESTGSSSTYSSSANTVSSSISSYSSTSPSISTPQQYSRSTRSYQAPPRNMPIGSIHSILSQDKDQYRLRPLTALYEGDSNYEDSEEASAAMVQMSEIHTLDAEEVEADITAGIDKMNLRTSYRRDIEEDEDDEEYYDEDYFEEDYDDYTGGATAIEEMEEVQMPQSMRRNWKEEQEWSSARY